MKNYRSEGREAIRGFSIRKDSEAIRGFSIRKDSEHGICIAVRLTIPPYLPIRKGRAPVTPLKGCDIYADSNRGNQCAGL